MALNPPGALEPAAAPVSDFGVLAGRSAAFVPLCTGAPELPAAPEVPAVPELPAAAGAPVSALGVLAGRSAALVPLWTGAPDAPLPADVAAGAVVVEPDALAGRSWLAEVAGGAAGFESLGSVVILPGDCASTGAANARAIAKVMV